MNEKNLKKLLKTYQENGPVFRTGLSANCKKNADLAWLYYPGIEQVVKILETSPDLASKLSPLPSTIGLLTTLGPNFYPLVAAKAGLLSKITNCNVIPLLIRYEDIKNLPSIIRYIGLNFRALMGCQFKPLEKEALLKASTDLPIFFDDTLEAGAVAASILSASKMMKKSPKKIRITVEGNDQLMIEVVRVLKEEGFSNLMLIDERGELYIRRPNMNRMKNLLASLLRLKKLEKTRNDFLQETDVYLSSLPEISSETIHQLPEKATIISLKALHVVPRAKQTLVSTIPTTPNHLTDLHLASGIFSALIQNKKINQKTFSHAIRGLSQVYKSPKQHALFPGLFEKNLGEKIAKAIP